jgi:hypothetical protein
VVEPWLRLRERQSAESNALQNLGAGASRAAGIRKLMQQAAAQGFKDVLLILFREWLVAQCI